jgi:hypothetical protein
MTRATHLCTDLSQQSPDELFTTLLGPVAVSVGWINLEVPNATPTVDLRQGCASQ